jgi:hypothetical protein
MEETKNNLPVPTGALAPKSAWLELKEAACLAYESGLLPRGIDTRQKAVVVAMAGRDLGLSPMQALCGLYVVQGMVAMRGSLMLRLIYERIPGARISVLTPPVNADKECLVEMQRPGNVAMQFRFSLDDAKKAGFLGKGPWQQHTSTMLRWAAIRTGARIVFADALAGCYMEDEIPEAVKNGSEPAPDQPFIPGAPMVAPSLPAGEVIDGEVVSPEEQAAAAVDKQTAPPPPAAAPAAAPKQRKPWQQLPDCITEKQAKRLFAIANTAKWPMGDVKGYIKQVCGEAVEHTNQIPWAKYDQICNFIEKNKVAQA